MEPDSPDLAARLADAHQRLDYPPFVVAGVHALPILDPLLDELDSTMSRSRSSLPPNVTAELVRLADLLLRGMLGTAPEAVQRRVRVIELLRLGGRGRLPPLVADDEDAFGASLRTMLQTDAELQATLGALYPLTTRATAVAPSGRWLRDAEGLLGRGSDRDRFVSAVHRVLGALLRADIQSRPDMLVGGLRITNQRFARGMLWLAFAADAGAGAVPMLEAVGLRMGTSGRSDAVVRDAALANTAAALLGESSDPAAVAALASMRLEITNRNVLKQVDRALAVQAARAGLPVDELVDASLPTFGLDAMGRLETEAGPATVQVELRPDGHVELLWRVGGEVMQTPPSSIEEAAPGSVAEVRTTADRIAFALAEEHRRLDGRMGSGRAWPVARWRSRFGGHPIGRIHARTLIWTVGVGPRAHAALPVDDGWIGVDESLLAGADADEVRLWHPAEAGPGEVARWRATLAARGITQAIRQAEREVFAADTSDASAAADTRHAGKLVDHSRLRALLRQRGWAVPSLGAWDRGDEATAWREFDSGLRAELLYQAPGPLSLDERVARARLVAVRFARTDSGHLAGAAEAVPVLVAEVPRRVFSEALRDLALVVTL